MEEITVNARQALGRHQVFLGGKAKILGLGQKVHPGNRDCGRPEGDLQEEGNKGLTGRCWGNGRRGQPGSVAQVKIARSLQLPAPVKQETS